MKRPLIAGLALALAATALPGTVEAAPQRAAKATALPPITIYHLEGRRSERIVWLMEELGLPYELEFKPADMAATSAALRGINPAMPVFPTVKYGDQVLVESGAIIDTIVNRHAPGRLTPPLNSPDYPYHLMWMHYAEGSLASRAIADYRVWMIKPPTERSRLVDSEQVVQFAEDYLAKHPWFGGAEFSTADIMMLFPLNFAMQLNIVDKDQFPNVNAWRTRIEARPAYKRMLAKARPRGMVGNLPALPRHAPAGPRASTPVR
ncbi:glutathione S-transferase family protein [Phenylobacterium sp. VNQ135]|uniref:glutathione S-transferase family protein n=1 Tax=Phenylobacterium sp. VNQ135 TaxID=3400922 RepID=UPI003C0ACEB8